MCVCVCVRARVCVYVCICVSVCMCVSEYMFVNIKMNYHILPVRFIHTILYFIDLLIDTKLSTFRQ